MKHKYLNRLAAMSIASAVLFNSCIGSFGLTNTVLDWNNNVGNNKWVNELVFVVAWIVPAYEISILIDAVVLNSIEFWTGSNPVAQVDKTIEGENGTYSIESNETGYTITDVNTSVITILTYDRGNSTWSATVNGNTVDFLTFVDENHVKMYGSDNIIELSESGVMAYKQQMQGIYPNLAIKH